MNFEDVLGRIQLLIFQITTKGRVLLWSIGGKDDDTLYSAIAKIIIRSKKFSEIAETVGGVIDELLQNKD